MIYLTGGMGKGIMQHIMLRPLWTLSFGAACPEASSICRRFAETGAGGSEAGRCPAVLPLLESGGSAGRRTGERRELLLPQA